MSIYLKDNSMILNTPETVDTVVAPVMPYTSLIMAGNQSLETAFRLRRYGNTLSQVTLNGPWSSNQPGFKADGTALAYFDVDVTQQVPRTLMVTGLFNKGARIAGIAFGDPDTLKSFYVERGSGVSGSGFPSKNFIPVWSGAAIGTAGKQLALDTEPDGALTLFISGDGTGTRWGVIYNGMMKSLAKDTTYTLSTAAGRTRIGGSSAQPTGSAIAAHGIYAAASFSELLTDDELLQMGNFMNSYASDMGATMYE
ncbi:hypothetical protein [Klebsiella michiganensis]|uniref:hypothetical protein n=1 Tax=Klebsiella michiganensis TaxID=1134687 RepID=UPI0025932172|nr:hypothetical protein [Klebsiella michiganensis]MDM4570276.1 hypothetical protein [Klebsiella michiganensis]MDM4587787.1 hypothetical protein [Klebsiella michiganensis]